MSTRPTDLLPALRGGRAIILAILFVMVVAAAEVVVGLGIIISVLRRRPGATADDLAELKG